MVSFEVCCVWVGQDSVFPSMLEVGVVQCFVPEYAKSGWVG